MRAALCLCLLLGAARASAGTFDWGTLPGELERIPIDGKTSSDGKRVFMELRRVRARPEEVLSHCLERFAKAGFHIPKLSRQVQGPGPSLTALDVETKTSYSVAVMPQPDGTLEVILGGAEHSQRVDEGAWPLVPPEAKAPLRSTTESARSVTFRTSLSPKDLDAWYQQELSGRGFVRKAGSAWERGAERVQLHASVQGSETVVTVWADGAHADGGAR